MKGRLMDISELRRVTAVAIGKDPEAQPENPEWDSLDQLEIITNLHEIFGSKAAEVDDLENFNDLESLAAVLRKSGLVD